MKAFRFFIAAATALMLCPAAALNARSRKEISPLAEKAASQHELCIEIGTICPMGMPSFTTTDGYKFTVKDGKVNADLPFFGESYTAIIPGADNPGITFKDCGIDIREDYSKAKKKGKFLWQFSAYSGTDRVDVTVTFWDNGSADISCVSTNRSSISYMGELVELPSENGKQ